jgi:hypothetical protein
MQNIDQDIGSKKNSIFQPKIAENCRKLPKIAENCRKLPKIAENCRKLPKIAENSDPNIDPPGYECLLGALEMGYNVDGYLVVDEKTLINPWNFKGTFLAVGRVRIPSGP